MLQNCLRLVLLDLLRHHVKDVVHDSCAEFEIIVRLNALLRDRLRDALAVTTLELPGKKITKPGRNESISALN